MGCSVVSWVSFGISSEMAYPIAVNSPAEDEVMDLLEAEIVQRAHVHPVFSPLLDGLMQKPA